MLKIAVCVSGGGTNLQAIIDSIANGTITNTQIVLVFSNNKKAYALERARKAGIPVAAISPRDYEQRQEFNQAFLQAMGYGDTSPDGALAFLRQRLAESPCFPHEIGVFLGYPLSDVIAFMRDGGRGCRCSGCWKAYTNECEAMRIFQRYKACRAAYQTLFRAGWPLERLTVRA